MGGVITNSLTSKLDKMRRLGEVTTTEVTPVVVEEVKVEAEAEVMVMPEEPTKSPAIELATKKKKGKKRGGKKRK